MRAFVKRLEDQGCGAICFTTDIMYVSHRERNIRNKFDRSWGETGIPRDSQGRTPQPKNPERAGIYPSRPAPTPTWETVRELRALTKLPIILKGILRSEDARLCLDSGVSGIIVSNHGARQLDHVGGTIEALPEVVKAVDGKIPVMIDGGFRRGTDILKALALAPKQWASLVPTCSGWLLLANLESSGSSRCCALSWQSIWDWLEPRTSRPLIEAWCAFEVD